ncbi:MAG: M50 family metallopeptidase [Candidatus Wildermuthbacteria bacterium]|nr:M50 family metallopeptidase [Candidatus Wildermuthbacteria bacterium]
MVFTFIIAFVSLVGLLVLHEFGHFIIAKRFGVKVEEFGIGYPPRLFGKKIGETIFSLNLLPFGAFVRVPGEIGKSDDARSFSSQPILKRALIMIGGVLSFWVMSAIIFSIVFSMGVPVAVGDQDSSVSSAKVQIASVSQSSPAKAAGLMAGDTIASLQLKNQSEKLKITKVKEVQELTENHKGEEIVLTIVRGKNTLDVALTPRASPPDGEGPMGVALVRTALKFYPWYQSPWRGVLQTFNLTGAIIQGYYQAIHNVFSGEPSGVQLTGPVGVFSLLNQASQLGAAYFLNFLGMISLYLAIFNLLPIPAVDGGKLLFLGIEAARKKPLSPKIEQNVTAAFFMAMIGLMIYITIGDVRRLF